MENNEGKDDEAADDHVTRRPTRFRVTSFAVVLRSRATIFDREQNGKVNVKQHCEKKKCANYPEQRAEIAQMLGVTVNPIGADKNLEVSQQMSDHEQNQNYASDGDNHFPPNRRMTKLRKETACFGADSCGGG